MRIIGPDGKPQMIGGAQRPHNPFPNITGGVAQTTRYDRAIVNLGPPTTVIDVSDFPANTITLNYTLSNTTSILAVTQSAQPRVMLLLRNDYSSTAGTYLYVAFNVTANAASAWFSIPVGGVVLLDTRVPQDDINIAASAATVNAIIGYVTYPVPQNPAK